MKILVSFYPPDELEQLFAVEKAIESALNDPTLRCEKIIRPTDLKTVAYTTKMKSPEGSKAVQDAVLYFTNRRNNNGI